MSAAEKAGGADPEDLDEYPRAEHLLGAVRSALGAPEGAGQAAHRRPACRRRHGRHRARQPGAQGCAAKDYARSALDKQRLGQLITQVKKLAGDWTYDVVSIGYPGPVALLGAAPSVSRRSPVSGLVACSPTHSSEVVSYKRDSLAFTKVNRSMAIHSNPGIHCNKERQMSARKNPRADLSDP